MKEQKYKVIGYPPKIRGAGENKTYPAKNYKEATNIAEWYTEVEWENFGASAQIVPISEQEYTKLLK